MASWVLCMALLLTALAGVVGETRYEKFLRQHVDYPRTPVPAAHRYCEIMLARRRVTAPGRPCKLTNTLVHAPDVNLVAACAQRPDNFGFYLTPTPMSLTICRLRGRDTRPPCAYRAQQFNHYVNVSCSGGLPVHLAGTRPNPL